MTYKEVLSKVGTNYKVMHPFNNEQQIWNLKNFSTDLTLRKAYAKQYNTEIPDAVHLRLPLIFKSFANSCYKIDQSKEETHG